MLLMKPNIKIFVRSKTENFLFDDKTKTYYQKVIYNENLCFIYYTKTFSIKDSNLSFLGIYSYEIQDFVLLVQNTFELEKIFIEYDENIQHYTFDYLFNDLKSRICKEISVIFEQMLTPCKNMDEDLIVEARNLISNNQVPQYKFDNIINDNVDITLDLSNLEDFCRDKDEYAYTIAEKIVNLSNSEFRENYQKYLNLKATIEYLNNNVTIDMEIIRRLTEIANEASRKTYKIIYETEDEIGLRTSHCFTGTPLDLFIFPVYAIKEIYWGKSRLYNRDDYDSEKLDMLRKDESYHKYALNYNAEFRLQNESSKLENFYKCMSKEIRDNEKFILSKINNYMYKYVSTRLKSDVSFIKKVEKYISTTVILSETLEQVIKDNVPFFVLMIKKESHFKILPESIKNELPFILRYINVDGDSALRNLPKKWLKNDEVQKVFDQWYTIQPANILASDCSNIALLANENTRINALSIYRIKYLSYNDIHNEDFMFHFLEKFKKNHLSHIGDLFTEIPKEIWSKRMVEYITNISIIPSEFWDYVKDFVSQDDNLAKKIVEKDAEKLYYMNDNIKDFFIDKNPAVYLKYAFDKNAKKKLSSFDIPENKLLDLLQRRGNNIAFLKSVDTSLLNDKSFAIKAININPYVYAYLSYYLKGDSDIGLLASSKICIIPYINKKTQWNNSDSLFDNKEIMMNCLEHDPLSFTDIPKPYRKISSPLLENKDFILFAIKKDPLNSKFLDTKSKFREDKDVCYETLIQSLDYVNEFAVKLYKDENFVYRLLDGLMKVVYYENLELLKNMIVKDVKTKLLPYIPKKIKNTKDFKIRYPEFSEY